MKPIDPGTPMNIKDITGLSGSRPVDASKGNPDKPSESETQKAATGTHASDQLTLTSVGQYLAATTEGPAPVDQDRVEAIRSALADGSYEIDSGRVAAKLLRLEDDLP